MCWKWLAKAGKARFAELDGNGLTGYGFMTILGIGGLGNLGVGGLGIGGLMDFQLGLAQPGLLV